MFKTGVLEKYISVCVYCDLKPLAAQEADGGLANYVKYYGLNQGPILLMMCKSKIVIYTDNIIIHAHSLVPLSK